MKAEILEEKDAEEIIKCEVDDEIQLEEKNKEELENENVVKEESETNKVGENTISEKAEEETSTCTKTTRVCTEKLIEQQPLTLKSVIQSFKRKYEEIEELESKVQQYAMAKRRRACSLLDTVAFYRKTLLKLFIHFASTEFGNDSNNNNQENVSASSHRQWKLFIEGTPLVTTTSSSSSLQAVEDEEKQTTTNSDSMNKKTEEATEESAEVSTSKENSKDTTTSNEETSLIHQKIHFTHYFDKITMNFTQKEEKKTSTKSKQMIWTRGKTPDAHGFHAILNTASTCTQVIVDIKLFRHFYIDHEIYTLDSKFQQLLLPNLHHSKNNMNQQDFKIKIPQMFTMAEILTILNLYIQKHDLLDKTGTDKTVVLNNQVLTKLFGCQRMLFSSIKLLLLERHLIHAVSTNNDEHPIQIQYIMKSASDQQNNQKHCHFHIFVPSLFHHETRQILMRIKNRELAYTSARTKAIKLLSTARGDEDVIKKLMEDIITANCYYDGVTLPQAAPVLLALEKCSANGSEAKTCVAFDLKLIYLMDMFTQCLERTNCTSV